MFNLIIFLNGAVWGILIYYYWSVFLGGILIIYRGVMYIYVKFLYNVDVVILVYGLMYIMIEYIIFGAGLDFVVIDLCSSLNVIVR